MCVCVCIAKISKFLLAHKGLNMMLTRARKIFSPSSLKSLDPMKWWFKKKINSYLGKQQEKSFRMRKL